MAMDLKLRVPANLLLSGEYAITEPGGWGYSVAVARYARLEAQSSSEWILEGRWPGGGYLWRPEQNPRTPPQLGTFMASVWNYLMESELESRRRESKVRESNQPVAIPPHHIIIGTEDFFTPEGRKRGLGSSAAATAALTAALFQLQNPDSPLDAGTIALPAVRAHRTAQGHRGSGYDVLTSLQGGWGRFRGGEEPQRERLPIPNLPRFLGIWPGEVPVSTPSAISAYLQWKSHSPSEQESWFQKNQENHTPLPSSYSSLLDQLQRSKELSQKLGEGLGIPSAATAKTGSHFCKWSGAGQETLIGLPEKAETVGSELNTSVAEEGLLWKW